MADNNNQLNLGFNIEQIEVPVDISQVERAKQNIIELKKLMGTIHNLYNSGQEGITSIIYEGATSLIDKKLEEIRNKLESFGLSNFEKPGVYASAESASLENARKQMSDSISYFKKQLKIPNQELPQVVGFQKITEAVAKQTTNFMENAYSKIGSAVQNGIDQGVKDTQNNTFKTQNTSPKSQTPKYVYYDTETTGIYPVPNAKGGYKKDFPVTFAGYQDDSKGGSLNGVLRYKDDKTTIAKLLQAMNLRDNKNNLIDSAMQLRKMFGLDKKVSQTQSVITKEEINVIKGVLDGTNNPNNIKVITPQELDNWISQRVQNGGTLAGYNSNSFDIPMIKNYFEETGHIMSEQVKKAFTEAIDVQDIALELFGGAYAQTGKDGRPVSGSTQFVRNTHKLQNLMKFFTGSSSETAHDAMSDVMDTKKLHELALSQRPNFQGMVGIRSKIMKALGLQETSYSEKDEIWYNTNEFNEITRELFKVLEERYNNGERGGNQAWWNAIGNQVIKNLKKKASTLGESSSVGMVANRNRFNGFNEKGAKPITPEEITKQTMEESLETNSEKTVKNKVVQTSSETPKEEMSKAGTTIKIPEMGKDFKKKSKTRKELRKQILENLIKEYKLTQEQVDEITKKYEEMEADVVLDTKEEIATQAGIDKTGDELYIPSIEEVDKIKITDKNVDFLADNMLDNLSKAFPNIFKRRTQKFDFKFVPSTRPKRKSTAEEDAEIARHREEAEKIDRENIKRENEKKWKESYKDRLLDEQLRWQGRDPDEERKKREAITQKRIEERHRLEKENAPEVYNISEKRESFTPTFSYQQHKTGNMDSKTMEKVDATRLAMEEQAFQLTQEALKKNKLSLAPGAEQKLFEGFFYDLIAPKSNEEFDVGSSKLKMERVQTFIADAGNGTGSVIQSFYTDTNEGTRESKDTFHVYSEELKQLTETLGIFNAKNKPEGLLSKGLDGLSFNQLNKSYEELSEKSTRLLNGRAYNELTVQEKEIYEQLESAKTAIEKITKEIIDSAITESKKVNENGETEDDIPIVKLLDSIFSRRWATGENGTLEPIGDYTRTGALYDYAREQSAQDYEASLDVRTSSPNRDFTKDLLLGYIDFEDTKEAKYESEKNDVSVLDARLKEEEYARQDQTEKDKAMEEDANRRRTWREVSGLLTRPDFIQQLMSKDIVGNGFTIKKASTLDEALEIIKEIIDQTGDFSRGSRQESEEGVLSLNAKGEAGKDASGRILITPNYNDDENYSDANEEAQESAEQLDQAIKQAEKAEESQGVVQSNYWKVIDLMIDHLKKLQNQTDNTEENEKIGAYIRELETKRDSHQSKQNGTASYKAAQNLSRFLSYAKVMDVSIEEQAKANGISVEDAWKEAKKNWTEEDVQKYETSKRAREVFDSKMTETKGDWEQAINAVFGIADVALESVYKTIEGFTGKQTKNDQYKDFLGEFRKQMSPNIRSSGASFTEGRKLADFLNYSKNVNQRVETTAQQKGISIEEAWKEEKETMSDDEKLWYKKSKKAREIYEKAIQDSGEIQKGIEEVFSQFPKELRIIKDFYDSFTSNDFIKFLNNFQIGMSGETRQWKQIDARVMPEIPEGVRERLGGNITTKENYMLGWGNGQAIMGMYGTNDPEEAVAKIETYLSEYEEEEQQILKALETKNRIRKKYGLKDYETIRDVGKDLKGVEQKEFKQDYDDFKKAEEVAQLQTALEKILRIQQKYEDVQDTTNIDKDVLMRDFADFQVAKGEVERLRREEEQRDKVVKMHKGNLDILKSVVQQQKEKDYSNENADKLIEELLELDKAINNPENANFKALVLKTKKNKKIKELKKYGPKYEEYLNRTKQAVVEKITPKEEPSATSITGQDATITKPVQEETEAVGKNNKVLEEHGERVEEATLAEAGKVAISKELAEALIREGKALGDSTQKLKDHNEQAKKAEELDPSRIGQFDASGKLITPEKGRIQLQGTAAAGDVTFDPDTHTYRDKKNPKRIIRSLTQHEALLDGSGDTGEFQRDINHLKKLAENNKSGQPITPEMAGMTKEVFDRRVQFGFGSSARGNVFHKLIETVAKSGSQSYEELQEKINNGDQNAIALWEEYLKERQTEVDKMAQFGVDEKFFDMKGSIEAYFDAFRQANEKLGGTLKLTEFAETPIILKMIDSVTNEMIEIGMTMDELFSNGGQGLVFDNKTGKKKLLETYQVSGLAYGLMGNKDWLSELFKQKGIGVNLDTIGEVGNNEAYIADIKDNVVTFRKHILLSLEEFYALTKRAVEIAKGISAPLTEDEQKYVNREVGYDRVVGVSEEYKAKGITGDRLMQEGYSIAKETGETDINKAITQVSSSEKKITTLNRELADIQKQLDEGATGELKNYLEALQKQKKRVLDEEVRKRDEAQSIITNNRDRLTDEQKQRLNYDFDTRQNDEAVRQTKENLTQEEQARKQATSAIEEYIDAYKRLLNLVSQEIELKKKRDEATDKTDKDYFEYQLRQNDEQKNKQFERMKPYLQLQANNEITTDQAQYVKDQTETMEQDAATIKNYEQKQEQEKERLSHEKALAKQREDAAKEIKASLIKYLDAKKEAKAIEEEIETKGDKLYELGEDGKRIQETDESGNKVDKYNELGKAYARRLALAKQLQEIAQQEYAETTGAYFGESGGDLLTAEDKTAIRQQNREIILNHQLAESKKEVTEEERRLNQERTKSKQNTQLSKDKEKNKAMNEYLETLKRIYKLETNINKNKNDLGRIAPKDRPGIQSSIDKDRKELTENYAKLSNFDEKTGKLITKDGKEYQLTESEIAKIQQEQANLENRKNESIARTNAQLNRQKSILEQLTGSFKEELSSIFNYQIGSRIFNEFENAIRNVIEYTKQLDANMVDLQIASGESYSSIYDLTKQFNELGNELGRTTSDVMQAANDWLRAGYDSREAAELTRASMSLSTLGMIDSSDATSYLISMLKGWRLETEEVNHVVDKLTAVDMAAAISAGDLAEGMSRANTSAQLAGSSMDNFIGYVTTITDVSQKSAASVGESMKTLYSRFQNAAAGKFAATQEEMESGDYNEDEYSNINDIETASRAVGIDIRDSIDHFRSFDEVLAEIASKWDTFNNVQQAGLATAWAGTRQRENFLVLMENWDSVSRYARIAEESAGTAQQKMLAYTDSIEAAQNRTTTALEQLALDFNIGDKIKSFYDVITYLTENLGKLTLAVGGILLATNGKDFARGTSSLFMSLSNSALAGPNFINSLVGGDLVGTIKEGWAGFREQVYQEDLAKVRSKYEDKLQSLFPRLDDGGIEALKGFKNKAKGIDKENYELLKNNSLLSLNNERLNEAFGPSGPLKGVEDSQKKLIKELANTAESIDGLNENGIAQLLDLSQEEQAETGTINPTESIAKRIMGTLGMGAGSFGGFQLGEQIGEGYGVYGTIIGSQIGSYAGDAVGKGIAEGMAHGGKAGLKAVGGLGWIALAATIASTIFGLWRQHQKKVLNEMKEDFKEANEEYQTMLTASADVAEYDKLVKGVDSLGRNVSLTNEEYEKFLSLNTSLSDAFPQLETRTDSFGKKLIVVNGQVGEITSSINQFLEVAKKAQAETLLANDRGWFGDDNGLMAESGKKLKEAKGNQLMNEQQGRMLLTQRFAQKEGVVANYNGVYGFTPEQTRELKNYIDRNWTTLPEDILETSEQYREEVEEARKGMQAYADALLVTDDTLNDFYNNLSEEEKTFFDSIKNNLSYSGIDTSDVEVTREYILKNMRKAKTIINTTDFETNMKTNMNIQPEMTMEQYKETRQKIKKYIENLNLDYETKINVMGYFGFELVDGNWIDMRDKLQAIIDDGLINKITGDEKEIINILNSYDVGHIGKIYDYLSGLADGTKVSIASLNKEIASSDIGGEALEQIVDLYQKLSGKGSALNELEKLQKNIIEKQLDKWSSELGGIKGDYDNLIKKAELMKGLNNFGTIEGKTFADVESQAEEYQKYLDYLTNDFDGKTWDFTTLGKMIEDANLSGYIYSGDIEGLKTELQEYLNTLSDATDNIYQEMMGKNEEASQDAINKSQEVVDYMLETYNIDLRQYKTLEEAKVAVNQTIADMMGKTYQDWVSDLYTLYSHDLINFQGAAEKKMFMNGVILSQLQTMGEMYGVAVSTQEQLEKDYQWYQHYGGTMSQEEYDSDYFSRTFKNIMAAQQADMEAQMTELYNKLGKAPTSNLNNTKKDDKSKSGSGSGSDSLPDEKYKPSDYLESMESLINKEWEAMEVFDELTGKPKVIDVLVDDYGVKEFFDEYMAQLNEAKKLGVDLNNTIYGNIDTNNRQVINWTEKLVDQYKWQLSTYGETAETMANSISTVIGGMEKFDGIPVAYSPILQTENGPILLSKDAVTQYINDIFKKANGDYSKENILKLDSEGLDKFDTHIKNMIADVGETAEKTSKSMHFTGPNGAINLSYKDLQEAAQKAGISVEQLNEAIANNNIESVLGSKEVELQTKYFDKMRESIQKRLTQLREDIKQSEKDYETLQAKADSYGDQQTKEAIEARNEAGDAYKELVDYQKQEIELQVQLNNLDDEQVQDEISLAEAKNASLKTLIKLNQQLLWTADTEEERVQHNQTILDLMKQQYEEAKRVREFYQGYAERTKNVYSGTAWSNSTDYDAMQRYQFAYNEKNAQAILEERDRRYSIRYDELMDEGIYTEAEAKKLAMEDEEVLSLTEEYLDTIDKRAEIIVQGIDDKAGELDKKLDLIDKGRPKEWTNISQIQASYNTETAVLIEKLNVLNQGLAQAAYLTDEQIQNYVDQINDLNLQIQENNITATEAIKTLQEKQFDAVKSKVEEYKDDLQDQIDAIEKAYEDELKPIQQANEERERAITLEEKLNEIKNKEKEKQRVFRAGIGWVYESPRAEVKKLKDDLKSYLEDDYVNDLEKTKDKEVELLQERINSWDKYIEMLQYKFDENQRIQQDKLLMDMLNVDSQEELYNKLETDMESFIDFLNNNNDSTKTAYDSYNSIFSGFINSYTANVVKLQKLQEQQIQLMDASRLLQLNNGLYAGPQVQSPIYNPNASNVSGKNIPAYDVTKDYSALALAAARTGNKELTRIYYDYRKRKQDDPAYNGKGFDVKSQDKLYKELTGIIGSFATGLDEGPVTETGLAMLHGTKTNPEYVLNSEQTYQMLKNLTSSDFDVNSAGNNNIKQETLENAKNTLEGINIILQKLETIKTNENLTNSQLSDIINTMKNLEGTQAAIKQFIETDGTQDREFYANITENFNTFQEELFTKLDELLNSLNDKLDQLKVSIDSTGPSFESIISGIGNLSGSIAELGPQLGQVGTNIVTSIGNLGSSLSGLGSMSVPSYEQNYGGFLSGGLNDDIYMEPIRNASTSLTDNSMPITPYKGDWSLAALDYARQGDVTKAFYCIKKREEKLADLQISAPGKYNASIAKYTQPKLEAEVIKLLHEAGAPGYKNGILNGPITETGLTTLHGTPGNPEYVLNSEQTYQLLRNLSTQEYEVNNTKEGMEGLNETNIGISEVTQTQLEIIDEINKKLSTIITRENTDDSRLATIITTIDNIRDYQYTLTQITQDEYTKNVDRFNLLTEALQNINELITQSVQNDTQNATEIITRIDSIIGNLKTNFSVLSDGLNNAINNLGSNLIGAIQALNNNLNNGISQVVGAVGSVPSSGGSSGDSGEGSGSGSSGGGQNVSDWSPGNNTGEYAGEQRKTLTHVPYNDSTKFTEDWSGLALEAAYYGYRSLAEEYWTYRGMKLQDDNYNGSYKGEKGQASQNSLKAQIEQRLAQARAKGWYARGIEEGPVTETGLAMLHGTPSSPEYVLNSEQTYQMLKNISTMDMELGNEGNETGVVRASTQTELYGTKDIIDKLNTIITNTNLNKSQLAEIVSLIQQLTGLPDLLSSEFTKDSIRYNSLNTILNEIRQTVNNDLENDTQNFNSILDALSGLNNKLTVELGNLNIGVGDTNTNITETGDKLDETITELETNISALEANIDKNVEAINGNVVTGLSSVSSGMTLLASGLNGRGNDLIGNYPLSSDRNLWTDGNDIVQLAPGQATKSSKGPVGGIQVTNRTAGGTYGYDIEGTKYIQANTGDWLKVDPKATLGVSVERRQDLAGKSVYIGGKILSYDSLGYYKGYRPPSSKNEEDDIRNATGSSSATSHNTAGTIKYGDERYYDTVYVDEKGNEVTKDYADKYGAYGIEYKLKPGAAEKLFPGISGSGSGGGSSGGGSSSDRDYDRGSGNSSGGSSSGGGNKGSSPSAGTVLGTKGQGVVVSDGKGGQVYRGPASSEAKDYFKNNKKYAEGLNEGPVTFTGLAMLHGTPQKPEYVLNNDQAYNILRNLARNNMPEFEKTIQNNEGISYVLNGDINLNTDTNPAEFWNEVTSAMGRRLNVTKNNRR